MNNENKRIPLHGTFELTGRCNLSCKMCLVRVDHKKMRELNIHERTAEEWIHMADQAAKAGTIGLLLTGGEVMLRPDFCEIYESIAQMGFVLSVYTNATMVTDKIMELFQRYPPHKIGVTMYGASNQTYERLCGCTGGFSSFEDGIDRLSSLPSLLELRTTIVKDNRKDLEAMNNFIKEKFGDHRKIQINRFVTKSIRGGVACAEKYRLTPEENIELIDRGIVEVYHKVKNGDIILPEQKEKLKIHKASNILEKGFLFKNCEAGIHQYTISWDGSMYACELMPVGCTKPFEVGFQKAWETLPECYPKGRIIEECKDCKYAAFCEACPAVRKIETDSMCQQNIFFH